MRLGMPSTSSHNMGPPRKHIRFLHNIIVQIASLVLEESREGTRNPKWFFVCVAHAITKLWGIYKRLGICCRKSTGYIDGCDTRCLYDRNCANVLGYICIGCHSIQSDSCVSSASSAIVRVSIIRIPATSVGSSLDGSARCASLFTEISQHRCGLLQGFCVRRLLFCCSNFTIHL